MTTKGVYYPELANDKLCKSDNDMSGQAYNKPVMVDLGKIAEYNRACTLKFQ